MADPNYAYPREELDRIWKTLMLNQFHDVLPGSSIAWVHREAREDYRRDLKRLAEIAQDMCAVLRKANPQADLLAEARISQFRNDGAAVYCWPTAYCPSPSRPTVQSRRCLTRSMAVNWFRPAPDWANTNC